jgi:regulator of replication initiation timing
MTAFDQARNLMQTELKDILFRFDALKTQLDESVEENQKLKKVIEA